jgi:GNAT superfamily N-acetyltransferase
MEIRYYRKGDYDLIIKLWEAAGLPYKPKGRDSRQSIEKEMEKGCGTFIFAVVDNKEVGVVLVTNDGRKGWINRVAVLPEYRKKGIARRLVNEAENWLESKEIYIFACQIEGYNDSSFIAFQKMGYIPFEGIRYLTKRKFPEI